MKKIIPALILILSSTLAHAASAVFTSGEARALTLPSSIEIASATLDLTQGAPAMILTGQDFVTNRYPAKLSLQNENGYNATVEIYLPRQGGAGCTEYSSASIWIIASVGELSDIRGPLSISLDSLRVRGSYTTAIDSCHSQRQTRYIEYVAHRY